MRDHAIYICEKDCHIALKHWQSKLNYDEVNKQSTQCNLKSIYKKFKNKITI